MRDFMALRAETGAGLALALAAGDLPALARTAHDLRTEAGNIGALALSEAAGVLQTAARRREAGPAALAAGEVIRRLKGAMAAVGGYLGDPL